MQTDYLNPYNKPSSMQNENAGTDHNVSNTGVNNLNDSSNDEQQSRRGRGWHGDPNGHAMAGRKGGLTVSRNREHMAAIGRKGGESSRGRQSKSSDMAIQ